MITNFQMANALTSSLKYSIKSNFVYTVPKNYSKVPKNNPRLLHSKYCTGLHKFKFKLHTGYMAHKTTRTSQAREFKFKSILCVSALGVTFMHALIRNCMRHCTSQFDSSSTLLFNTGSQHTIVICTQQQEV